MTGTVQNLNGAVRQPRVLIVDDDPTVRMFLAMMLDTSGFDLVGEAGDVEPAVVLAAASQPDIILLDMRMPSMSGEAGLPLLRAAAPRALVVVVSADAVATTGPGRPDAYIAKDGHLTDLAASLREILAGR